MLLLNESSDITSSTNKGLHFILNLPMLLSNNSSNGATLEVPRVASITTIGHITVTNQIADFQSIPKLKLYFWK